MSEPQPPEGSHSDGEERGYPLRSIYFYLTEGCNLACRHCWIAPKYQDGERVYGSLDPGLFRSILREARSLGLTAVKLTGGEPLLHPAIGELLGCVREEAVRLTIETNGVLCTPELVGAIASCHRPFVSVSIDGATAKTHEWVRGVKGCFEQAIQGVRNLVDGGLRPQLIMTIMQRNRAEMAALVQLAERLGAGSVKFNIVQPTARGQAMHDAGQTLTIEELVEVGEWVERELVPSSGIRIHHSHPLAFRPLSSMFGDDGTGCGICSILSILGVLADGSYALCGIGESVPDLVFGHAEKDSLACVWNDHPVLREIREGMTSRLEGICCECVMRERCLGCCLAQNYFSSGSLWAPYWYCSEAARRGLFPSSRLRGQSS